MKRAVKLIGIIFALIAVWIVAAELIFLFALGKPELVNPLTSQWLQTALWARSHALPKWVMLWLFVAGAVPTIIMILLGVLRVQMWRRNRNQGDLYGTTGWANENEMRGGGITPKRRPF